MDTKILTENGGKTCNGIEWNGKTFYLRKEVEMSEIGKPLDILRQFDGIFDTSFLETKDTRWDEDTLDEFLEYRTELQYTYLKVLMEAEDWLLMDDIKKGLEEAGYPNQGSKNIGASRSGNTRAADNWYGKEPIDEREWDNDEDQNKYRIKPKYLGLIKKVLPRVEKKRGG